MLDFERAIVRFSLYHHLTPNSLLNLGWVRGHANMLTYMLTVNKLNCWRSAKALVLSNYHFSLCLGAHLGAGGELVVVSQLERGDGLEETRAIQGAGGVGADLDQLRGELGGGLGASVGEELLDSHVVVDVGDLAVHLHHGAVVAHEVLLVGGDLQAARLGLDRGISHRNVGGGHHSACRGEALLAQLGDELDLEVGAYGFLGDDRGQHGDHDISRGHLGSHEGREVRLALLDVGLHLLAGPAALSHVSLDLPGELDLIGDV
mmetsp:Transcript_7866/g.17122  ORF Transcript_7866/g.17122 Transcript_7866/m.17122 type:complete len:262 (+) Transcript_7866:293-1078(+)